MKTIKDQVTVEAEQAWMAAMGKLWAALAVSLGCWRVRGHA
ncbi:hypothetical protein [Streptomyces sp. HC307]